MLDRMSTLHPIDTGLTPAHVALLIDHFYDKVRKHATLGPVFNAVVEDWDAHKRLLTSFWCSVALRANSYHGNPMAKHRPLPIDAAHFQDWLALWRETTREMLEPSVALRMIDYAQRIGQGLQLGMGLRAGAHAQKVNMLAATPPRRVGGGRG